MAKIKKVTMTFDLEDLTDVVKFKVYYNRNIFTEENEGIPFVEIPVVAGQNSYNVEFPTAIPVMMEEGQWNLGVVAVDDQGNEGDMDMISPFFDFVPPAKPVWRK